MVSISVTKVGNQKGGYTRGLQPCETDSTTPTSASKPEKSKKYTLSYLLFIAECVPCSRNNLQVFERLEF